MKQLILIRHGQSVWNLENKFTGWTDVDLSEKGILEARQAGQLLKQAGFHFEVAFVSKLLRAQHTLSLVLEEMKINKIDIHKSYKLNERHYGALQGLNKADAAKTFGEQQVHLWRRSYRIAPPSLETTSKHEPKTESLYDTYVRVKKYFNTTIKKALLKQDDLLIVAHGNSLRSLCKYLLHIDDKEIENFEIPTGKPLIITMTDKLQVIKHEYL